MADYPQEGDLSSLERARERLYAQNPAPQAPRAPLEQGSRKLPHAWENAMTGFKQNSGRHVRLAGVFFVCAVLFFIVAVGASAYLLYFGGNSVSVNNITLTLQGPTTIAGGDTVPLSVTVTNRNSVAIENATLQIDFPAGTRSADDVTKDYQHYSENLGILAPGQTVTRSVKAVVFGGDGQALSLPVALSYSTGGSNAVFVKKTSYALGISTTPLSISVVAPTEAVSGKPFTVTITARSNATTPLTNVVVSAGLPFGFSLVSSVPKMNGNSFVIGTLAPGASQTLTITGALTGADASTPVFHFTIGTANDSGVSAVAVSYMQQDATIALTAPFLSTSVALNGDTSGSSVVSPNARQSVTLSYTNTLATAVTDASIQVTLAGGAIDYNSIQSSTGFYQSATHTIIFDKDRDPSLASLAPNASGIGTFTFLTLPSNSAARDPLITITTSVSGKRVGQSNVPEIVSASTVTNAKVSTAVALSAIGQHTSGTFVNSGPIPPLVGKTTTYSITWQIQGGGNALANATVSATLPSYITYTNKTSGQGSVTYDSASHIVTWNAGDLPAGAFTQASFQVSLTPSSSQRGGAVVLSGPAGFTGFDRFAQVSVTTQSSAVTTETTTDAGYVPTNGGVQ